MANETTKVAKEVEAPARRYSSLLNTTKSKSRPKASSAKANAKAPARRVISYSSLLNTTKSKR